MPILINIAPDLRTWILHNLSRGCAPTDLVSSMVEQRFDPAVAQALIDAFVRAQEEGLPPPQGSLALDVPSPTHHHEVPSPSYNYESPRLARGNRIVTSDNRVVHVLARTEQPRLAVLANLLSAQECAALIELAKPRLQPSTVVDPETGTDTVADYRNSEGMFFGLEEAPFIATLDRRISEIMGCPVENGEGLQVLRYGPGTRTTPHFDFLIPSNDANRASLARSGQRVSSLVIYLNHVASGGETVFPEVGLSVVPQPGNAVYFEYSNTQQQVDYKSLHAGAPVLEGEKWAVTKWMRARRFVMA